MNGSIDLGQLQLEQTMTVNAQDHVQHLDPLESVLLLNGLSNSTRPFCPFTDSPPRSPLSAIVFKRKCEPRHFLVTERRFSHECNCWAERTPSQAYQYATVAQTTDYVDPY